MTKNQFISIVSHDLRSPLSTVKMGLELLKEEQDPALLFFAKNTKQNIYLIHFETKIRTRISI